MKPLHIFTRGRHTDSHGQVLNVSEQDLRACADAYDPALHEAPIVTGHPTTDAPAYGWIKQLSAQGRDLLAEPQQVDPAFSELVTAGRYKKISASFYLPHAPNNPAPGALYLRHVGFLGAQPPAVKGLRAVSFADTEDGVVEFTEDLDDSPDSLLVRLRALLSHYVGSPSEPPALTTETLAFSEPGVVNPYPTTESLTVEKTETEKQLEAENAALKQQISAHHAEKAAQAAKVAHDANVAFAETLMNDGRLAPAGQPVVVALLDALTHSEKPLEFTEGSHIRPLVEAVKSLLTSSAPLVDFRPQAVPGRRATPQGGVAFSEQAADPDTLHQQAMALKARESITYEAAVKRCLSGESHV
ncbi:MAG: hypothetical protein HamCj_09630 [Candidatus Hamiltonella defensa (Ceratovacuna japonica)]